MRREDRIAASYTCEPRTGSLRATRLSGVEPGGLQRGPGGRFDDLTLISNFGAGSSRTQDILETAGDLS